MADARYPDSKLDSRVTPASVASGIVVSLAIHVAVGAPIAAKIAGLIEAVPEPSGTLLVDVDTVVEKRAEPPRQVAPEPEPAPEVEEEEPGPAAPSKALAPAGRSQAAPAAAKAGRVLTAPATESGEEEDIVDFSMVQGLSERYVGGVTSRTGTSDEAVRDRRARGAGPSRVADEPSAAKPRQRRAQKPKPRKNLSRPPRTASTTWNCPFPFQADTAEIHHAVVMLVVTVKADGRPKSVQVLSDPGHGFGAAARRCAHGQRFVPAHDPRGRPTMGTTRPFRVTFRR